ncbi:MAG: phosphotransferase enzyme family protein, partial [Bacteroidota bacterium]
MISNPVALPIAQLFEQWAGEPADLLLPLARSASNRQYFRLKGKTQSAIGCYGPDRKENQAFLAF